MFRSIVALALLCEIARTQEPSKPAFEVASVKAAPQVAGMRGGETGGLGSAGSSQHCACGKPW